MAGNDLRIKIVGSLNVGATIGEINSALRGIEKKINKLKLNVQIDDKISKTLADFSKAMQNHKEIAKDLNKVLREEETILKKVDGTTEKLTRTYLKSGEIIEKTRKITDERTKSIKKEEEATGDLIDEIEKFGKLQKDIQRFDAKGNLKGGTEKYRDGFTDTTYNFNKDGKLTSSKTVENLDQQENATKQFQRSIENSRQSLVKLYDQGKVNEKFFSNFNKVINSAKNVQEIEKVEKALQRVNTHANNKALQQKLINDTETLLRTHRKTVDVDGANDLLYSIKQIKPNAQNAANSLQQAQAQLKGFSNGAKEAARQSMTLGTMLSTAMTKFPVWMLASTAFYAPLRAMESMVTRLVEIDTLMTDINRVMDVPDFKLTEMLNEAVQVSDELSSKLTDVLKIMGDFGRMGFQENELIDISKTAQVLQNISDLDAKGSVDTLTSAMLNFNIAASDSVKIADQLNEVDNNFAISTKDLSDGLRKAASTAKTFGVDMEELVGYIAGIGSTTRESGAIIGNGLKTIFSRLTTMNDAKDALASVNISIKDIGGNVKPVSDILGELAGKWTSLTDEQRQNLGVSLAGRYQLSRFLALMNNWQLSVDATNTALNSQGSSMREQAKYADSLEGRINRLDTAWNKLTISTGNAFLTDGIIATVETLNDLATVTSKFVDSFGVLSGLFGTVGAASVLLSTRLRTLSTSLIFGTSSLTGTTLASAGLSAGMSRASVATTGLKVAMRGLLASTVVGAVFVGIGFALEKLIKLYSDAKQKQEAFEESQRKNIDALTTNKKQTDNLISSYKEMSKQRESGKWDTENEKEFLKIQQQLGELYPSLISSIDATGQFHIKTTDAIDKEIKSTQELLKLKRDEIKLNAHKTFEDNVDKRDGIFGLDNQVKRQRDQVEELRRVGADKSLINKEEQELFRLETELSTMAQKATDEVLKVAEAYQKLEIDPAVSRSVQSFVSSLDLSKLNPTELEAYAINVAKITDEMQRAYDRNDTKGFEKAKDALISYAQGFGATDVQAKGLDITLDKVKTRNELLANTTYNGTEGMDSFGESMEGVSDQVDGVVQKYDDAISSIKELNGVVNELNDSHSVSSDSINFLMEKYPHLLQYLGDEKTLRAKLSEEIEKESLIAKQSLVEKMEYNETFYTNAIKNSGEAVKAFNENYGIDLKQFKTLAQAKQEIDNRLRKSLGEAWNDFYKDYSKSASGMKVPMGELKAEFESVPKTYWQDIAVREAQAAFNDISLSGITPIVSKAISSSGLDKPKKEKEKSTKDPISQYVSDEYQKALDSYNLKLDESRAKQSQLTESSEDYRKQLVNQSAIYRELINLTDDEISRLSNRNAQLNRQLSSLGSFNKLSDKQKEKYNELKKEIDDNTKSITNLKKSNIDFQNSIDETKISRLNSELSLLSEKLEVVDDKYTLSQKKQSIMIEGSSEYAKETRVQNALLAEKESLLKKQITQLEGVIEKEKLSSKVASEYQQQLESLNGELLDIQKSLFDYRSEVATESIEVLKKSIEMERDLRVAAKEEEIRLLDEAHERKLEQYDEDVRAYEKSINDKLRLLDDQDAKETFNNDLSKLQSEKSKVDKRYNQLMLDDSQWAESERLKLQEESIKLQEQIDKLKHDRQKDLRKQNLQDELDTYKEEVDNKKKAEEDKHKAQKDSLEEQLKNINYTYNEMLANEEYFSNLFKGIMTGNIKTMETELDKFLTNFKSKNEETIKSLGLSWQSLQSTISGISGSQSSLGSVGNIGTTPSSQQGNSTERATAWQKYLTNNRLAETGNPTSERLEQLRKENDELRRKYGFQDGRYEQLKNLEPYHEGGLVGGRGSKLAQIINNIANNLKPDERIIKAKVGETMIPEKNMPNFIKNIGNLLIPKQSTALAGVSFDKLIHIENFNGTPKEINNLENRLVNTLKNLGKI